MRKTIFLFLSFLFASTLSYSQFPMQDMDPVSWSHSYTEVSDGVYTLNFKAEIDKPWHMYALHQEQSGPIPTNFSFEAGEAVSFKTDMIELTKPVVKFDEGFRFDIGAYYDKAEFERTVVLNAPGKHEIKVSVEYQCCDDEVCLPPFTTDFSFILEGKKSTANVKKEEIAVTVDEEKTESLEPSDQVVEGESDKSEVEKDAILEMENKASIVSTETKDEDDASSGRSMAGFLVITFLLGLAAILTPCVYPMIPMTISFFMRGNQNKAFVVLKGLVFGLSMILVYTGLGVLVALTGLDANIGNIISTHWLPNIIFFLLFMIFAASFLGMFEIVLPSGLVNKVDKQADRGGLLGPFFMGITTVLVSFSCTGPIVGSLLTEAAGGEAIKPVLGMFFFSLAFALPFTLLAIFPSMMKSLPKSGGWLNAVKVVLGFMMLAFGLKFLSSMDQAYHLNIFTREIYLAIWFVIAVFTGFYLLGKIRFPHDTEMNGISVPRLLLSMASFVFAIYLFTGIFGNDLKAISSLIPPKTSQQFKIGGVSDTHISDSFDQNSSYCGPGRFDDMFELPYGIKGYFTWEDGLKCAKENNKPIFLDFTGHSCSNCKQMESQVWSDPEVLRILKEEYVVISLYTDDKTKLPEDEWITTEEGKVLKTIGEKNVFFEIQRFNTFATPWYVLLDSDGNILTEPIGKELDIDKFKGFLEKGLE